MQMESTGALTLRLATGTGGIIQCGNGATTIYGGAFAPSSTTSPWQEYTNVVNAGSGTTSVVTTLGSDENMYLFGSSGATTITDGDCHLFLSCGSGPTTLIHSYVFVWGNLPIIALEPVMFDEVSGFIPGLDVVQLLGYSQSQIDYMLSHQQQIKEPSGQIDVEIQGVGVPVAVNGNLTYPVEDWVIRFDNVSLVTPKFFGLTSPMPPVIVSPQNLGSSSNTSIPGGKTTTTRDVTQGTTVAGNSTEPNQFQFGLGGGTAVGGSLPNAYAYGQGDGAAVIQPGSGSNTLTFGYEITASMLSYAADAAGDLTITVGNSGDSVTIKGNFAIQNGLVTSAVSGITLANGSSVIPAPPPLLVTQEQDVRIHAAPNSAFSFTLPTNSFTDVTGGTVALSALQQNGSALPLWLSFAPSTGKFTGTMPAWQTTQGIKVIATTSEGAISAEGFNIYNTPPTPVLVTQQQDVRLHYAPTTAFSFVFASRFVYRPGGWNRLRTTRTSPCLRRKLEISSAGDSAAIAGPPSSRSNAIMLPIARRVIVPRKSVVRKTGAVPGRFSIGNVDASRHGPFVPGTIRTRRDRPDDVPRWGWTGSGG